MTTYDLQTFRRALILGCTLSILVFCVMVATDGALSTFSEKLGRVAVLAPLLGAVGALIANAQAGARGEFRALAAIGVSPSRASRGAMLAVLVAGMVGTLAIGLGWVDVGGLLPRLQAVTWERAADGSWTSLQSGVRVDREGSPYLMDAFESQRQGLVPTLPISVSVMWIAMVLADWIRESAKPWERMIAAVFGGAAGVVAFHLVAAGRTSAWMLLAAPLPVLAHAWLRRGWRLARERRKG